MDTSTIVLAVLITSISVIPAIAFSSDLARWLRKKYYQYEVTFAVYMMTPREKFLFNSFIFLSSSMLLIASLLYLPEHAVTMSQRAFYYWTGYTHSSSPQTHVLTHAADSASSVVDNMSSIAHAVSASASASASAPVVA